MVFLVNYEGKDSSGTIYVAFRDPEQILKIRDCHRDSGTVGAYRLLKFTDDLPTEPVSPVTRWKHLSDLKLADSAYGVPAGVDISLGGKVFRKAVLHGRRYIVPQEHRQRSRRASSGY